MSLHESTGSTEGIGQKTIPRKEDYAFFAVHAVESTFLLLFYSHNFLKDTDDLISTKCTRYVEPRTVLS
jgi:hypothetical protein